MLLLQFEYFPRKLFSRIVIKDTNPRSRGCGNYWSFRLLKFTNVVEVKTGRACFVLNGTVGGTD